MNNIKFNSISGKIEDSGRTAVCVEFNTWHNDQGIDLTFYGDPEEIKTISLSKDELHCIAVIASAINYIDIPEASKEATSLLELSEKRLALEKEKYEQMAAPNALTLSGDLTLLSEDLEESLRSSSTK